MAALFRRKAPSGSFYGAFIVAPRAVELSRIAMVRKRKSFDIARSETWETQAVLQNVVPQTPNANGDHSIFVIGIPSR